MLGSNDGTAVPAADVCFPVESKTDFTGFFHYASSFRPPWSATAQLRRKGRRKYILNISALSGRLQRRKFSRI
jgi:hypothetical protein